MTQIKLTCDGAGCGRRAGTARVLDGDPDLWQVTVSNVPRKGAQSGLSVHSTRAVTARLSDGRAPDGPWPLEWPCDHCDHTCVLDLTAVDVSEVRTLKV